MQGYVLHMQVAQDMFHIHIEITLCFSLSLTPVNSVVTVSHPK